jgi:hypothetical protein
MMFTVARDAVDGARIVMAQTPSVCGPLLDQAVDVQAPQQSSFIKPIRLDENQLFVDRC